MNKNLIRVLLASAALAAASGPTLAQPAPPPAQGGGHAHMDPAQHAEMRAQKLRDVLQLRPNQEPALAELTRALAPPADARQRMDGAREEMAALTTPERLDKMRERMARRQQAFDVRAMAIKKFYAQLTPAQQKSFDAMGPMMGHGRGGEMGHGRMGGDRHGGGWEHGDKGPGDKD